MQFTKESAVERAMDAFWRNGYGATTPQDLATELGIGKGSLYNSFESKHNLFALALRRYSAMRIASLAEVLGSPGPARPKLKSMVELLAGVGSHEKGCFVVNSTTELPVDDEVSAVADDLFDRIEASFAETVRRGQVEGELRVGEDPEDVASGLLATVIGLSVLSKAGGNTERLHRVVDAAIDAL